MSIRFRTSSSLQSVSVMTDPNNTSPPIEPSVVYDFDPHNLPAGYLEAVGLVVAASAQTEDSMSDLIGGLLGIDNMDTAAVATHMSFPLKSQVIRALAELKTNQTSFIDELDDLLDTVKDAMDKRNVLVHNPLLRNPDTNEVFSWRLKARGSLQLDLKPITVDEIKQDAALIYEVGLSILTFMESCGIPHTYRQTPLMMPLDRGKKARAKRREAALKSGG